MNYFLIWLAGACVLYAVYKTIFDEKGQQKEWEDIYFLLVLLCGSWATLLLIILVKGFDVFIQPWLARRKSVPPKWLQWLF